MAILKTVHAPVLAGLIYLFAIASALATTAQPQFDHKAVARTALEKHIRPGFQDLKSEFQGLLQATSACTNQSDFDFQSVRPAFRTAVMAWGRVAHMHFGPLAVDNRFERIFFWHDRKGIARRQMTRALRDKPEAYLSAAKLAKRSIAVQGLTALEYLIVTPVSDDDTRGFKCGFANAIAGNLLSIADKVDQAWQPGGDWAAWWTTAGPDNPEFLARFETTFKMSYSFFSSLEQVIDVELARPLGIVISGRKFPGPFKRSGLTMPFIAARISGLHSYLEDTGLVSETLRIATMFNAEGKLQGKYALLAIDDIKLHMKKARDLGEEFAAIENFFESPRTKEAEGLILSMRTVRNAASYAMAATTDLPKGFNAADGD